MGVPRGPPAGIPMAQVVQPPTGFQSTFNGMMLPPSIMKKKEENRKEKSAAAVVRGDGGGAHEKQMEVKNTNAKNIFVKKDFPGLGGDNKGGEKDDEDDEDANAPLIQPAEEEKLREELQLQQQQLERLNNVLFNNPNAPPVSTAQIASSLMPQRDVQYVLNVQMRSLYMKDPFTDDYYFHNFSDRKIRSEGGETKIPLPVWHKKKMKAQRMEKEVRREHEERSKKWESEQGVLGHTSKSDSSKPRALLAVPVLKKKQKGDESNEDHLRRQIWMARTSIGKGFDAFLKLQELQRLVRCETTTENGRALLMNKVRKNINHLEKTMGIVKTEVVKEKAAPAEDEEKELPEEENDEPEMKVTVDNEALKALLMLPKGQELLARSIESGLLPHSSATLILPRILKILLVKKRPSDISKVNIEKEERMLKSFSNGLIKIAQPQIKLNTLKLCLKMVLEAEREEGVELKDVLSAKARAEVMLACVSRGGELDKLVDSEDEGDSDDSEVVDEVEDGWKKLEADFMSALVK